MFFILYNVDWTSENLEGRKCPESLDTIILKIPNCSSDYDFAMKLDKITTLIINMLKEKYTGITIHKLKILNWKNVSEGGN